MDATARDDYLTLFSWTGCQTSGLGSLLRDTGSPLAAVNAPRERLAELPPSTQRALSLARKHWPRCNKQAFAEVNAWLSAARRRGESAIDASQRTSRGDKRFLPLHHGEYPQALRSIPDPPPWLFCRGNPHWLGQPAVAIVGTRRASFAGLEVARELGRTLAEHGYTVCSGLALGIDGAAHRGALQAGATVAVIASGLDCLSPRQNLQLAREIGASGCLVSELPPGTPPGRHQFPRRNRIISGLAQATIIVEAALPSGTLHTAAAALEQGRDVYVLPWSIAHAQGAGCLQLLRDGAFPITSMDDVADLFPPVTTGDIVAATVPARTAAQTIQANSSPDPPAMEDVSRRVLELIGDGLVSLDNLQRESGMSTAGLLILLGELELTGSVQREDGLYRLTGTTGRGPAMRQGSDGPGA